MSSLLSVHPVEEFGDNAKAEGISQEDLLEIALQVAANPRQGECICSLYGELGMMPNAGFYLNEWKIGPTSSGRSTAYSLHLFVSRSATIYLWDIAAADYRHLPWLAFSARTRLREKGRAIAKELMTVEGT